MYVNKNILLVSLTSLFLFNSISIAETILHDTFELKVWYSRLPNYYSADDEVVFPITYSLSKHPKCVNKIEINISLIYDNNIIPIIFKQDCPKGGVYTIRGPMGKVITPYITKILKQSGKKFDKSLYSVKLDYIKYY